MNTVLTQKVALVVDDEHMVCNMLVRVLGRHFDEVLAASSPAEAERLLSEHKVTHMICDCNLGPCRPLGVDLIPRWRSLYASVERVVVFSGSDLSKLAVPPEIDAVVSKGGQIKEVLEALQVR